MNNVERIAYSIPEACEVSSLGKSTIYKAIRDEKLNAKKIGKRTIILRTDLETFLNGK